MNLIRTNAENQALCAEQTHTMKEAAEVIHDYWMENNYFTPQNYKTPEQIFKYSKTGELSRLFHWFWEAKAYFTKTKIEFGIDGTVHFVPKEPPCQNK